MSGPAVQQPGFVESRRRGGQRCGAIDVHELMKREIYAQTATSDPNYRFDNPPMDMVGGPVFGPMAPMVPQPLSAPTEVTPVVMQNGTFDTQLLFESPYALGTSSRPSGSLSWDLSAINNNKSVTNIIEIRTAPFFIPNFATSTTQPDLWFYRRVLMVISDLPEDGVGRGGAAKRYHFIFAVTNINSISVELVPEFDTIYLRTPLNALSQFSVQLLFPSPYRGIPLPSDTVIMAAVAGSNPARFTLTSTADIGPVGIPVPTVAIFISDFNNGDVTLSAQVNDSRGWMVTNIVSTTVIEIAGLNFATVVGPTTATAIIGKNRIEIPMRFTSVTDKPTNYITPTHS